MSPQQRRGRPGNGEEAAHVAALSGGGPSQLGVDGSMRARDVSRPKPADLADAERLVQVSYRPRSRPTGSHSSPASSSGQGAGNGGSSPVSS